MLCYIQFSTSVYENFFVQWNGKIIVHNKTRTWPYITSNETSTKHDRLRKQYSLFQFWSFTKFYYCCWHHCAANATVSHVLLNIHSNEKQDGGQVGLSDLNPRCHPEILLRTIRYKALDYSCTKEMTWLDMTIWLDGKKKCRNSWIPNWIYSIGLTSLSLGDCITERNLLRLP